MSAVGPGGEGPALDPGLGYVIRVPAAWQEIDVRPASRDASISTLVNERTADVAQLRPHRTALTRLMRQYARSAWDGGAVFCAVLAEPTEDGMLPAAVTVSFVRGPLSTEDDRLAGLVDALRPAVPAGPKDPWLTVTTVEVEGAGFAARCFGVDDIEVEGGRQRAVLMQTFVPVPGVNRVAIISCSSPATAVADGLLDLFDAVSSTFRLVQADDLLVATGSVA